MKHPLFGNSDLTNTNKGDENTSHQHGQGNRDLMDTNTLVKKYQNLPNKAIIIFDGFAILQVVDNILSDEICRKEDHIKHLAFLQYPFCVEPDTSDKLRELCKRQEKEAILKLDHFIGASDCSVQMFYQQYRQEMQQVRKTSIITPRARFIGRVKEKTKFIDEEADVKFLCVSNTVERKNIMLMLKALKLCTDTFNTETSMLKPWNLSIICNNTSDLKYRKSLETYIEKHKLPVKFIGEQRDPDAMAKCFLASDIFIHSSNVENYCMAASEAVCCGCIIVSSEVGELISISMSSNLNDDNDTEKKNAWLYKPNDLEQLTNILISLLTVEETSSSSSSLLVQASKDAIQYASDIDDGKYDYVFNTEETFATKWNDIIDGYDDTKLNINTDKGPNPRSIRWSHCYYLFLTLISGYFVHLNLNVEIASTIWLIFSITSFVDMYIFRQSGFVALLPHIIHHIARVGLYYMMYIFPDSKEGWNAAVRFNYYNFWLSISILLFGLGRDKQKHGCLSNIRIRRPTWWKHLDLIFYFCLIPQRIKMYMYAKQFNSITYDDLESLGVIMTVIEIGNAINKLLFWWQFGEKPSQSRKKTRENYKYVKRKVA